MTCSLTHEELFENDVKTYGTQTKQLRTPSTSKFENDVKTYGTQTHKGHKNHAYSFENDVKTYGTQTNVKNNMSF